MSQDAIAGRQRNAMLADGHSPASYPSDRPATLHRPMAKVCHSCGKGPAFGNSRSHSMVATKRRFDPNLQKVRIMDGKAPRRVYVCTRCLKAGKVTKAL
jgi:large subunit ribosomal protein L28